MTTLDTIDTIDNNIDTIDKKSSKQTNKSSKSSKSLKKTLATPSKKKFNKYIYKTISHFNFNSNSNSNLFSPLRKSFTHNFLFWIAAILSVIYLSKLQPHNNIIMAFVSFFLAMIVGWSVHYASHNTDFTALYLKLYNKNFFYFRSFIDTFQFDFFNLHHFILNFILYTADFHDQIHHDSSINKKWHFILIEFIQNVFMEGGIIVLFSFLLNFSFSILGNTYFFNHAVIWMWAFLYATVHNINYLIIHPDCHIEHHLNEQTNFGIDTLDILFNTKYDMDNVEIFNHAAINIVIITLILTFLIKYKKNNPFILFFKNFL